MSNQTRKIISTIIFIFTAFVVKGQYENEQLPKFMPPPPNAFQITKGADVNVGLNTGTANISLPLFDISAGGTKIPLTLNYSSNGVTVDEVASRTGINWTLNIGGVISRTVIDEDDEYIPLKTPPANMNNQNDLAQWAYQMMPMGGTDWYNTQPDEYRFNVNGLSGKFFYDHTGPTPAGLKLTSFSDVKIEKNVANTVYKFKLTGPDGIVYYFGGPNATEKSKYQNPGCARANMYNSYSDVAYYISKIEFPNGETIVFNYSAISYSYVSNVTQTFVSTFSTENSGANGGTTWGSLPGNSATTCQSEVFNMGVVLSSVICSNGTTVTLGHIERQDVIGEKAVSNILLSFNGAIVNRFLLTYTYSNSNGAYEDGYYNSYPIGFGRKRLFLVSVLNLGRTGNDGLETVMTYNDMDGMPSRLSTAQDHFGYFNGQHNQLYVPALNLVADPYSMNVDAVSTAVKNNLANTFTVFQNPYAGNKEPSFNHAVKGTLQSIRYPTGGTTSIEWESNTVNKDVTIYPAPVSTSIYALGTCTPNSFCAQTTTRYISTGYQQYLTLSGAAGQQGDDQQHSTVFVVVTDITNNNQVFSRTLKFNESFNANVNLQGNATFRIELTSTTSEIPAGLTYEYRPGNLVFQNLNTVVPGLRVKKITDHDGINSSMVKKYLYYKLSDPLKSSGQNFNLHYFNIVVHEVNTGGYWQPGNVPYIAGSILKTYIRLQGTSNFRNYLSGGNTINYTGVVESLGENFENGGTEHIYGAAYNAPGQIIYGNEITGAPHADNSMMNGLEQETTILKKSGSQLVPVSKTVNEYSIDPRNFSWYNCLVIQSRNNSNTSYQYDPQSNPNNLKQFDIMAYPRYVSWVHLDKTTSYLYDENANEFKTEKSYTYGNTQYSFPTEESDLLSDNTLQQKQYKYVKDYNSISGLSSNAIAAASLMISKNIVAPQLEKKVSKNNILLATTRTDYKIWNSNMPFPEIISSAFGNVSSLEPKIWFNKYDPSGNVNELSKENDTKSTYLWGYSNLYPILEATNATSDEIFYNSFETDNNGVADNNAKTGFKVAVTGYTVNFTPPNSKQYTISYNTWDGTKWNFTEQLYTGNSFTITAAKIDEVRVYPKENVLITTHTYWPLIGVTSICDPNNKVAHYVYDAFNRLSFIRDEDGNVLKKICYNYVGQQINCGTPCIDLTPYWQNTASALRCQKNTQGVNTGYQEQEQQDMNSCSPTYQQTRWILAGQNTLACPLPPAEPVQVNLTSTMLPTGYSGYTAVYYNLVTQVTYTFNVVNATGLQSLGTVPEGVYTLTISRTTGTPWYGIFKSGCFKQTASGASATFYNVNVSTATCNSITIDLSGIE